MSVVDYHSLRETGSPIVSDEAYDARADSQPMRYRGWVLIALGLGSWVGLFKICGWL